MAQKPPSKPPETPKSKVKANPVPPPHLDRSDPVDQANYDSFPASDPPSYSGGKAQPRKGGDDGYPETPGKH